MLFSHAAYKPDTHLDRATVDRAGIIRIRQGEWSDIDPILRQAQSAGDRELRELGVSDQMISPLQSTHRERVHKPVGGVAINSKLRVVPEQIGQNVMDRDDDRPGQTLE